jgi:hypothetical protein
MKSKRREHERYLSNKKTLKSVVSPEEVKTEIGDPDIKEKIEGVFEKTVCLIFWIYFP